MVKKVEILCQVLRTGLLLYSSHTAIPQDHPSPSSFQSLAFLLPKTPFLPNYRPSLESAGRVPSISVWPSGSLQPRQHLAHCSEAT